MDNDDSSSDEAAPLAPIVASRGVCEQMWRETKPQILILISGSPDGAQTMGRQYVTRLKTKPNGGDSQLASLFLIVSRLDFFFTCGLSLSTFSKNDLKRRLKKLFKEKFS